MLLLLFSLQILWLSPQSYWILSPLDEVESLVFLKQILQEILKSFAPGWNWLKALNRGQWEGSVGEGACHQVWRLEFDPCIPCGGGRELISTTVPLTSTYKLWYSPIYSSTHVGTLTHPPTQINKHNNKKFKTGQNKYLNKAGFFKKEGDRHCWECLSYLRLCSIFWVFALWF